MITREQGENRAREIGAAKYMECDAFTQEGISAIHSAFHKTHADQTRRPQKLGCVLLALVLVHTLQA